MLKVVLLIVIVLANGMAQEQHELNQVPESLNEQLLQKRFIFYSADENQIYQKEKEKRLRLMKQMLKLEIRKEIQKLKHLVLVKKLSKQNYL